MAGLSDVSAQTLSKTAVAYSVQDNVFSVSGNKYDFLITGRNAIELATRLAYTASEGLSVVSHRIIAIAAIIRQLISSLLNPPIPCLIDNPKITTALMVNTIGTHFVSVAPDAI